METDGRVDLLRSMIRIRGVEETLADLYPSQEMRTPTHFSIGQEAVAVGVCADPSIFVAGIGVDDFKGVFGTTAEAFRRFGPARVFDIPNGENAMTGIAIGAAAVGKHPLVVHPRNDFMFLCMDQLLNLAAKWRYMFGNRGGVPVSFEASSGGAGGRGRRTPRACNRCSPTSPVSTSAFLPRPPTPRGCW